VNYLQSWLKKWAHLVERVLFCSAAAAALLIIASQLIMINDQARYHISRVDSLEGKPYDWQEAVHSGEPSADGVVTQVYWVELGLSQGEGPLEVLRNGAVVGDLERGSIIVYVNPGDIIEVRGDATREEPVTVEVISTRGLINPRAGIQVTTFGDYELIGWAVPKNGE